MHKIQHALSALLCMKVPRVTFSIDYAKPKLEAIKTAPGMPEERQQLLPGPKGMAVCTWANGQTFLSDVPNLLLDSRASAKLIQKRPAAANKGKGKGKAKAKAKAKAKPEEESSDDESGESEQSGKEPEKNEEEEEEEEEEKKEEGEEAKAEVAPAAEEKEQSSNKALNTYIADGFHTNMRGSLIYIYTFQT